MGFIKSVVKHTLFIFNLIFTLIGLLIIAAGGYLLYYVHHCDIKKEVLKHLKDVDGTLKLFDYFLIAVILFGSVIFLISFCGCCGSISEKKGLLIPYAVIMFVLISGSMYLVISKDKLMGKLKTEVETYGNKIFDSTKDPLEDKVIHVIQFSIKCCGPEGPQYYKEKTIPEIFNITNGCVSPTCYSTFKKDDFMTGDKFDTTNLKKFKCDKDDLYETGCITKINKYIEQVAKYIYIAAISVAAVELLAMLFAIYMCVQISNRNRKSQRAHECRTY